MGLLQNNFQALKGSVNNPAFSFLENPDTGIYYDELAEEIVFAFDGEAVARIDANGISTTIASDNLTLSGTLDVAGAFAVNTDKFTVSETTGNTTVDGTLGVTGNVAVNTNKFTVTAASGNTVVAGTLGVTGAATLSSTLDVTGDVAVNTNKFTVTASSGNTVVAGTLGVTGASSVAGLTITETGASVFNAGRLGATTPAFQVVGNVANSSTGVKTTPAASGSGVAVDTLGGTNEALTISAKGTGLLVLQGGATGSVHVNDALKVTGGVTVADIDAAVTANVGSSQGTGEAITKFFTNISVCATAGDAVTLPDAPVAGQIHIIANSGAESADVFPNTDDTIDGGSANAAVAIAAGKRRIFIALSTTAWISVLGA